jgi:double zinc ribbon protein
MKIHLSLIRCRYCEHENPADAKFCGACGGELHLPPHLASCPRCGAVNSASATVCIWCHGPFPARKAGALVAASPAAKVLPLRPTPRAIAVAVVLAAIGALGYYGYRQNSLVDEPRAAGGEAAADAKSADDTSTASGNPLAAPARAAANPPRAGRQTVESPEGKSAAAANPRSLTVSPGKSGEAPPRQQACTEGLAALGLCASNPGTGKAGGPEPSGAAACTAEAAALGLCAPRTPQRRE